MSKFVHMELNTDDPKAAKAFYKGVFGWTYQDMKMPDGVYSMIMTADGGIGGIQKNPMPGAPSSWLGYVAVDSVKRTIKKVERRGGKVLLGETEVMGSGKLAIFMDPQGAAFGIWEASGPAPDSGGSKKKASKKKAAKKKASKKEASKKKAAKKRAIKKK